MIYIILAAILGSLSAIIDYKYKTKSFRYIMVFMLGMLTAITIELIQIINEILKTQ